MLFIVSLCSEYVIIVTIAYTICWRYAEAIRNQSSISQSSLSNKESRPSELQALGPSSKIYLLYKSFLRLKKGLIRVSVTSVLYRPKRRTFSPFFRMIIFLEIKNDYFLRTSLTNTLISFFICSAFVCSDLTFDTPLPSLWLVFKVCNVIKKAENIHFSGNKNKYKN